MIKEENSKRSILTKISVIVLVLVTLSFSATFSTVNAEELCSGQSGILIEATSGRILYGKNIHQKLPMASTTKIATAITVIENCDIDEQVSVSPKAVGIEGSSIYLRANEKLTVRELLYGLMLRSGNDTAVALALHVSKTVEDFAVLMNETAKKVGAINTNFVNPHGLHDENHYTTAHDLALISAYALQNKDFEEIVSCRKKIISNDGMDYKRELINKNRLLGSYEYANGVKTGYTKAAGRCFVGSAVCDGMQLVAVVLNCGPMFEESRGMLEYGFKMYRMENIVPSNKLLMVNEKDNSIEYKGLKNGFSYPLLNDGSEAGKITKQLSGNSADNAIFEVYFDKQLIFSEKLVTI